MLSLSVLVHYFEIVSDWKTLKFSCSNFLHFKENSGGFCWDFAAQNVAWIQHLSLEQIRLLGFFVKYAGDIMIVAIWLHRYFWSLLLQGRGQAMTK